MWIGKIAFFKLSWMFVSFNKRSFKEALECQILITLMNILGLGSYWIHFDPSLNTQVVVRIHAPDPRLSFFRYLVTLYIAFRISVVDGLSRCFTFFSHVCTSTKSHPPTSCATTVMRIFSFVYSPSEPMLFWADGAPRDTLFCAAQLFTSFLSSWSHPKSMHFSWDGLFSLAREQVKRISRTERIIWLCQSIWCVHRFYVLHGTSKL